MDLQLDSDPEAVTRGVPDRYFNARYTILPPTMVRTDLRFGQVLQGAVPNVLRKDGDVGEFACLQSSFLPFLKLCVGRGSGVSGDCFLAREVEGSTIARGFTDQHDIQKGTHAGRAPLGVRTDGQRNTCSEHGAVRLACQQRVRWIHNDYHAQIPNLRQEIGP